MMLSAQDVSHAYEHTPVLHGVDLDVEHGEIVCLLGASGSGKTTLLRILAGLEAGYKGHVALNGKHIDRVPAHKRGFGLMFQDFALFPHLSVADNIAFGLKMQNQPQKAQRKAVNAMLELVGLVELADRYVDQLSGGERQRVALARSLAPEPRLLMLDEPLGSLDAALRDRLVVELRQIIKRVNLTTVYVTHDQQEAFAIADRIAIMYDGRIEQVASPQQIYWNPQTRYIAQFLGLNNLVTVQDWDANAHQAQTTLGQFTTTHPARTGQAPAAILLHPDGLHVVGPAQAQITGSVQERVFQGRSYRLAVRVEPAHVLQLSMLSNQEVPQAGATVGLTCDYIVALGA
jgi:ABC-type Fe3+/spermidine/putrescine transport system ATPase subunit